MTLVYPCACKDWLPAAMRAEAKAEQAVAQQRALDRSLWVGAAPKDILDRLAALVSANCVALIWEPVNGGALGEQGYFASHPWDPFKEAPQIRMFCTPTEASASVATTLGHEFGHFLSWRMGRRPPDADYFRMSNEYGAAIPTRRLAEDEQRLLLEEESRAWELGHVALDGVGFTAWEVFAQERQCGLDAHRERLAHHPHRTW